MNDKKADQTTKQEIEYVPAPLEEAKKAIDESNKKNKDLFSRLAKS